MNRLKQIMADVTERKRAFSLRRGQAGGQQVALFVFVVAGTVDRGGAICRLHPWCQSESHYCRGQRRSAPGKLHLNGLLRSYFQQDKEK